MRLALTLVLCLLATACRRAAAPATPAGAPAQAAAAAAPSPAAQAEPAEQPAPTAPVVQAAAPAPPPASEAAAPAAPPDEPPAPAAEPEKPDNTIYRWVDAQGVLHFSTADDIPPARRASARPVGGRLTVEDPGTRVAPPPPPAPAEAEAAEPPAEAAEDDTPGDKPKLDAQGLPIPGTMKQTAHTRSVQQATGQKLDPASVERKHQQELRDMKCREVDGVTICG